MIYYFLPDPGIAGGVKVAFQFLEALNRLGVRAVAALPEAKAPQWFAASPAVVDRRQALRELSPKDYCIITWPPDYEILRGLTDRLVCHCQGVENMEAIFRDQEVMLLTCWQHTQDLAREKYGRDSIPVGISVSGRFFRQDGPKLDNRVAYMPRRGLGHAMSCLRLRGLDFDPLDGLDEEQVSLRLGRAGIYLATALGEDFGLPALEAMASGCLVVSVPVLGGMEYLRHSENCLVAEPADLAAALGGITRPEKAGLRALMRSRALATAYGYHPRRHKERLARLLGRELKEFTL